jgi:hypothetical protein
MRMNSRRAVTFAALCLVTILWMPLQTPGFGPSRIVAIGDIHGALPEFLSILQKTGLIDGNRRWTGGAATLIQTGDVLDRGAQSRECLNLVMDLERQAAKAGGKVIPMLGNHEAMNLMGDVRYVTPEIYGTFGTDKSQKIRDRAYEDFLKFLSAHQDHAHTAVSDSSDAGRQKWMAAHPPGYFEYRDAMGPGGTYGRWIRKHRVIFQAGDGLFVHGGLNPALKFSSIAELDSQVHAELDGFDALWKFLSDHKLVWRYMTLAEAVKWLGEEVSWVQSRGPVEDPDALKAMQTLIGYKSWMAASSDGPLWYRGLAEDPEEKLKDSVAEMLVRLKANFIVDGHTVLSKSDIIQRFENHVFLIDTGMLKGSYSGRASALEIKNGQFTAYYAGGESKILAAPGALKKEPAAIR